MPAARIERGVIDGLDGLGEPLNRRLKTGHGNSLAVPPRGCNPRHRQTQEAAKLTQPERQIRVKGGSGIDAQSASHLPPKAAEVVAGRGPAAQCLAPLQWWAWCPWQSG